MSNLNAREILLLHLNCISFIDRALAFNEKWDNRFNEHQKNVGDLIKTTHQHYIKFLQLLIELRNSCIQGCFALDDVRMELLIVIENRSFDNVNIFEIIQASRRLQTVFDSLYQKTKTVQNQIFQSSHSIKKEKKKIKKEDCSLGLNGILINTALAAVPLVAAINEGCFTNSDLDLILPISIGGISMSAIAGTLMTSETKRKKLQKLDSLLDRLNERIPIVNKSVDDFSVEILELMQNILRQVALAENNLLHRNYNDPVRNLNQARLMLENTDQLAIMFKNIQVKATENSKYLRTLIRVENPRSLLDL